jgi:hypothetical protein
LYEFCKVFLVRQQRFDRVDTAVLLGVGGDILEEMDFCGDGLVGVVEFFDECD